MKKSLVTGCCHWLAIKDGRNVAIILNPRVTTVAVEKINYQFQPAEKGAFYVVTTGTLTISLIQPGLMEMEWGNLSIRHGTSW